MNLKEINPEHNIYIIRVYNKEGKAVRGFNIIRTK
jgi:hypothetical protein